MTHIKLFYHKRQVQAGQKISHHPQLDNSDGMQTHGSQYLICRATIQVRGLKKL